MRAKLPEGESLRLAALQRYRILDTLAEQAYDDITRIAAYVAQSPIALISLVDTDRQWFKSAIGLAVAETPRELAFCAHAILEPDGPLIVPDATKDRRFADNPLVTGNPDIRFYLGAPLVTPDRHAIGTLCVIDRVPRAMTADQVATLSALSRQVVTQLELRRYADDLRQAAADREGYLAQLERYQRQLEQANAQLEQLSLTDKLTGLGNRAAFDQRLAQEISRSRRHGLPLSLLMIDVDRFKAYNDAYGHPSGDATLQALANVMRESGRSGDFFARYGGEEFAVILPITEREGARIVAERLRKAVAATAFAHRPITVSIGASTLASDGSQDSDLVAAADRALYAAKHGGRNRCVHADAPLECPA